MAQALRGDVKDFWRYSTFSDWAKIGDFRCLPSVKKCTECPYFNAVHVDLVVFLKTVLK